MPPSSGPVTTLPGSFSGLAVSGAGKIWVNMSIAPTNQTPKQLVKCDGCGQKFDESQATQIYYIEEIGDRRGEGVTLTICPNCEAKRTEIATIIAWVVVVFCGLSL